MIRRVLDFVCSKHNHTIIYYRIILYYIIYTHNTDDFDDVDDRNKYNNNYSNSKNDNDESKIFLELVMV